VGNHVAGVNGWSLTLRYGKIARMAEQESGPAEPGSGPPLPWADPKLLHDDLSKEYYALLDVVSNYDGWLLIVKDGPSRCRSLRWVSGFSSGTTPCSSSPQ